MADTTINLADLAQYGITEESLTADREAIAHGMVAEDFLAHIGIEVPDEPDDEFYLFADDVIAHFGIPGMKWGRRRPRTANGLVDKSAKPTVDRTKVAGARSKSSSAAPKKSAKSLTNEELSSAIRRLQLEQQYNQLTAPKKPAWRAETEKILGNALRQNAQSYANQYLGVGVGALLQRAGVPNAQDIANRARQDREAAEKNKKD